MHDATDGRELAIELKMGWQVGRGTQFAFEHATIDVNDDHVIKRHGLVGNATGFDDDGAAVGIARTDVAPGEIDQTQFWQFQVGLQNLLFQGLQHQA